MNSKLEKIEKNTATLEIEIDAEQFERGLQKAYKKNVSKFNIPGFRKGKAPRIIIERHYGEGIFYEDAINMLCPDAYDAAIEEHGLHPVDKPQIDIVQIEKGKSFIFKAVVVVKPEVKLGEYKGIEIEKKEYPVSDEDVEKELSKMRDGNARMVTVEGRPAKEGDMLILDYKGFVEDEQFEGSTAENQSVVLGSGRFIPGFEEQLVGANAGDDVEVKVKFPEEYHSEGLAGKDAVFQVKVKEIKEKELPVLDDEFAKDVSEFDTLEDLKKDIKDRLEQRAGARARNEMENEVIKKVTGLAEIEVPEVMIEKQIDSMIRDFELQLMYQGLKLDDYLNHIQGSVDDLRNNLKQDAEERVRTQLTLEKISEVEGITETQEELNEEIEKMAKQYRQKDLEKFRESLGEDELNYLKNSIIVRKTIDYLVENAKIS
ncbi:MAG: Cell division trigger factor [Firmicutes bacterium]|nr:Cell division trigger factor [Bacillota bacterium]MDI6705180.1 trigger factor [Bacillota bacterium]